MILLAKQRFTVVRASFILLALYKPAQIQARSLDSWSAGSAEKTDEPHTKITTLSHYSHLAHANSPANIRGLKWRQDDEDEFLQDKVDWWLALPENSSKVELLQAVASRANTIAIRVDDVRRFKEPAEENYGKAMDEIAHAVLVAQNHGINLKVYLWARIWMENGRGEPFNGTVPEAAQRVKEWFTPVFERLIKHGTLGHVAGIVLVETNTHSMNATKEHAKRIADVFNAEKEWEDEFGHKFFETRTFMMPGAGFGLDFRNVGNDDGEFLEGMHVRCKYFAFLYKYMKAYHETVTEGDYEMKIHGSQRSWETHMEYDDAIFTVEDRKEYLNTFGLTELTRYVDRYKDEFPRSTNVVFWGDKWDGISRCPPQSRIALQELFSRIEGRVGYMFNLSAYKTSNPSARKFYLLDSALAPNTVQGWSGLSVVDEWELWRDVRHRRERPSLQALQRMRAVYHTQEDLPQIPSSKVL